MLYFRALYEKGEKDFHCDIGEDPYQKAKNIGKGMGKLKDLFCLFETYSLAFEAKKISDDLHLEFLSWVAEDKAPMTVETISWISEQLSELAESMPEFVSKELYFLYVEFVKEADGFLRNYKDYSRAKMYHEATRIFNLGEKVLGGA